MLQSKQEKQESIIDSKIPLDGQNQSEEGKQEARLKIGIDEVVPECSTEEKNCVITPAFAFSASRADYSEQVPQQNASAFSEINQNSSLISLGSQRPLQSLLTPTLFMKSVGGQVSASLPLRSAFQQTTIGGGGSVNIGELNNCTTNAANSEMNAQNDAEIQRMIVDQHQNEPSSGGFTVVGTLKQCNQTPYGNKYESPTSQKLVAQRSLSFMQQQAKQSPVKIIMQRQQTTPAKDGKLIRHDDDVNGSNSKNKENFNATNFTHNANGPRMQGDDQNMKMLHMQMFDSPDKRAHLKNQISAQNESPAANSCQSAQIAFANLNLSQTAGKYQSSAAATLGNRIQSGAILGGLHGPGIAPSGGDNHSTSKYDEFVMKHHLTQSPMFKGAFIAYSPKGSPFQARMLRDSHHHTVITSLNMKMETHAQDNDLLPMQIMSKQQTDAERSATSYLPGGDVACEAQRIFNPDLDEDALNQLKSLGPTPQRPGAISKSGEKELKARRLFQSPSKDSPSQSYPQDLQRTSYIDDRMNAGGQSVPLNNLQTASISSQVGFKQLSGSKAQSRKTYHNTLEEIAEEPQRAVDLGNNNSLNCPMFINHHHPFDSMMVSNNSAQLRLNSMLEGPNSGDSGRKMKSYISTIVPEQQQYSTAHLGQNDFSSNHNPLQTGRLVSRLDNEFTMAENANNHSDDNQYTSFINPLSFLPGSIEQNHFSFNLNHATEPQQHLHHTHNGNNHPQFQFGSFYNGNSTAMQDNLPLIKKYHVGGGIETSSQMRMKNVHQRNVVHNFQQFNSTHLYEGKKSLTSMSFGNFQNEPIYHQCKCGANYPLTQIVKTYQHNHPTYGDAQSLSSNGGVSQHSSIRRIAHTGNRLRHNHHPHHIIQGGGSTVQRSLSMKVTQRNNNITNGSLPPNPHHHRVHKGTSLHKQAARQAAQNGMMPQFDLKNSNFINTNIQMNVYIPSPTEQQQQAHSSQSSFIATSQQKLNHHDDHMNDTTSVNNQISMDMEGAGLNMDEGNNLTISIAANKTNQIQGASMSSSKKNTSGLKKRLYPQFLNSSNKKVNATPSTNSCLQNSTSKSNQKSNMKRKLQEINNQQQISSFDVNHPSQSQNHPGDDSKFQTPKGPNIFHHQLSIKGNSSSGVMQGVMSFSTPDDDKDIVGSSTQKTHHAVFQHSIANHQRHHLLLNSSGPHSDTKLHNFMESGDKSNQPMIRVTCNCKKSKCLKLYCDCFALGLGCGPDCNCQDCCNTEGNEERKGAMESILERNPQAFKPKIPEDTNIHSKGCRCKKSGCQKKYCECYQSGVLCSDKCVCDGCLNCDEHSKMPKNNHQAQISMIESLRMLRDSEDQLMAEEFPQIIIDYKQAEEVKHRQPEVLPPVNSKIEFNNTNLEIEIPSSSKIDDSNQNQNVLPDEQYTTGKKSRGALRSSAVQDLDKIMLSSEKNQVSPGEVPDEIPDNLEAKHFSRKRRALDLNQPQIIQNNQGAPQLTSTPIAKRSKQMTNNTSNSSAKSKNLVNRAAAPLPLEVQQPEPPTVVSNSLSGKKAPVKQSELKKTPIKHIQMMSQNHEDAGPASCTNASAAKQQEQPTSTQRLQQPTAVSQPAAAAGHSSSSCITTRSKRKQLEAATSLSDQKPQRNNQ